MFDDSIVMALASAFLGGVWQADAAASRGAYALGHSWRWLGPLARRVIENFVGPTRPRLRDVVQFLSLDEGFASAFESHGPRVKVVHWIGESPLMQPCEAAAGWPVRAIESPLQLAEWLGLKMGELEWFADLKSYLRRRRSGATLRHYHYRILAKESGSIRLIEAPKERLKAVQEKILREILDQIPPHEAAHGFRKGRSIKSFVGPHVGRQVVLKLDLQDFFPSIRRNRVQALFRTAGYPEGVADLLGGLCTTATPREIWGTTRGMEGVYAVPHLPQGAPTSPAIANLCGYRFDSRLNGLARAAGAEYTRYADDLAFSAGEGFRPEGFIVRVMAIMLEEGFEVHSRKTRVMRQGVRQQLAGLVVNKHANARRSDFDELKAILTNCVRLGPGSQNREGRADFRAHLAGRVGFVESVRAERGAKLRRIYERIVWS